MDKLLFFLGKLKQYLSDVLFCDVSASFCPLVQTNDLTCGTFGM